MRLIHVTWQVLSAYVQSEGRLLPSPPDSEQLNDSCEAPILAWSRM